MDVPLRYAVQIRVKDNYKYTDALLLNLHEAFNYTSIISAEETAYVNDNLPYITVFQFESLEPGGIIEIVYDPYEDDNFPVGRYKVSSVLGVMQKIHKKLSKIGLSYPVEAIHEISFHPVSTWAMERFMEEKLKEPVDIATGYKDWGSDFYLTRFDTYGKAVYDVDMILFEPYEPLDPGIVMWVFGLYEEFMETIKRYEGGVGEEAR